MRHGFGKQTWYDGVKKVVYEGFWNISNFNNFQKIVKLLFKGEFNKIFKIKILKYFFIHPYFSPISFPIFSLPCFVIVFSNFLDFYDLMLYLITISWHFCF